MPIFLQIFATSPFILDEHWYLWKPELLPIASDLLIASAYYSISIALIYFFARRRDARPFNWILLTFTTFIIASGTTHLIEGWTLSHPTYWLGYIKLIAAAASMFTALLVIKLIPKALTLLSPAQLEALQTDLQQARLQIERLDTLRQEFLNCTDEGVYGLDLQGKTTFINKAAAKMVGRPVEEMLDRTQHAIINHSKADGTFYSSQESPIYAVLQDGKVRHNDDEVFWRKDGTSFPVEYVCSPIREEGKIVGALVTFRDLTERKQAQALKFEQALSRIRDKAHDNLEDCQIFPEVLQEVVEVFDLKGCNAAWYTKQKTSKICYEYVISIPTRQDREAQMDNEYQYIYDLLRDKQHLQFCSLSQYPGREQVTILAFPIIDKTKEEGEQVVGDLWLIAKPGTTFNDEEIQFLEQVAPVLAAARRQSLMHIEIKAKAEEQKKLHAETVDFISGVRHDLLNPMNIMRMAVQMLSSKDHPVPDEKKAEYFDVLLFQCNWAIHLIHDLQTLPLLITFTDKIDLQEILPSIIALYQAKAAERQQSLQFDLPRDLPLLESHSNSLQRILNELLNNACKYTPAGGKIVFSVDCTSAETIFTIRNSAEIPADQLERIFEKGYRVSGTDSEQQGFGQGLANVKKLVTQLQGSVSVESANGWTTFTVKLPNQPSEAETV